MIKELKSIVLDFTKFTTTMVVLALIVVFVIRILGIPI